MTQRLPIPGSDDGTWGDILNGFLEVSLNTDGTIQSTALVQAGGITTSQVGQPSGVASLNSSGVVPIALLPTAIPLTNLSVSGTASSSTYLRGDGTWSTPNSGSSSLASDTDVSVVSPANNQVLTYNNSTNKWENLSPAVATVFGRTGTITAASGDYSASQVTGALVTTNNLSDVGDAGSSRANLHIPVLTPAAAVATSNISLATPGATIDGYSFTSGDLVLLTNQSTASQNGLYTWTGASSTLTRPTEFASGATIKGRTIEIQNGTVYMGTQWALSTPTGGIVIDSGGQEWSQSSPYTFPLSKYVNDFTGSTDQTSNLQSAVNAANAAYVASGMAQTIYKDKPGTFLIAGTVVWASGVNFTDLCGGTTFKWSSATSAALRRDQTDDNSSATSPLVNCKFTNIVADGSLVANGTTYSTALKAFFFQWCQGVFFQNCTVLNSPATAFGCDFFIKPTNTDLKNGYDGCYTYNFGRLWTLGDGGGAGIGIGCDGNSSYSEVYQVTNCLTVGVSGSYGIFCESQTVIAVTSRTSSGTFTGNVCLGGYYGIGLCGGNHHVAADNLIRNMTDAGIIISSGTVSTGSPAYNALIEGNNIELGVGGYGIYVYNAGVNPNGIQASIKNNKLIGSSTSNIGINVKLASTNISGLTIADNDVSGCGDSGMYVSYTSGTASLVASRVIGNYIYSNGAAGVSGNNNGIIITATCSDVEIAYNRCSDPYSAGQAYGLSIGATFTGGSVHDNDLIGNSTAGASYSTYLSTTTWWAHNAGATTPAATALSPGASPWTYTAPAWPSTLNLTGGTITGLTIAGATAPTTLGSNNLEPLDSVVITYTGTLVGTTRAR